MSLNLRNLFLLVLSIIILILIFKNLNRVEMESLDFLESFSPWDSYNTKQIKGKRWQYPNPTTRIEYNFIETDPYTNEERQISPVTWNSYVNHELREHKKSNGEQNDQKS